MRGPARGVLHVVSGASMEWSRYGRTNPAPALHRTDFEADRGTTGFVRVTVTKNERARFYRGMILKLLGRMGEAIRDFREVAEANPRHTDAVREVRLYSMRHDRDRRNKDEGTGSLLGKFMKKK